MNTKWKIGVDIETYDNLLDGVTFDDLILAVNCNCRVITPDTVKRQWKEILEERLSDAMFLLNNNMNEIIVMASKGKS